MEQAVKQQEMYVDAGAVFELLALLSQQGQAEQIQMIQNLSTTIAVMENNLNAALTELKEVKAQLNQAPKTTVKDNAVAQVKKLESSLQRLKNQLSAIKEKFVATAQSIVDAVKETGITALDKTSEFLHLKENLTTLHNSVKSTIAKVDKNISTVNAMTQEANAAGKHIKNIGRAIMGKERDSSMAQSAESMVSPLKAMRKMLVSMGNKSLGAIGHVENLSKRAEQIQAEKPSVLQKLKEQKTNIIEPKINNAKSKEMAM